MKRIVLALAAVAGIGATGVGGVVERRYRGQPGNALDLAEHDWRADYLAPGHLRVGGHVTAHNPQAAREVMIADVRPTVRLLSDSSVAELSVAVTVLSNEPKDYPTRPDQHWTAYVVKPKKYGEDRRIEFRADVTGPVELLDQAYAAWFDIAVDTYGFEGLRTIHYLQVVPLRFPDDDPETTPPQWRASGRCDVLAIRTHLLSPLDDPAAVIKRYVAPYAQPGDLVTIGESPVAVMQRRMRDPRDIRLGWFARRLCQFMSGEGSLGTATGMQALMDQVGVARVVAALAGGKMAKLAGQDGWFYRLTGEQSRLIDDVTGTLPPYDRHIVLGPLDADAVCADIETATGLLAAVVDANDLGRVDLVGASSGVDHDLVKEALRPNPAGNGFETTPIVLIRPRAAPRRP